MKHKKEYAEKMYLKQLDEIKPVGFVDGYMKAIEETVAPDLLEALNLALLNCKKLTREAQEFIDNAIKKATE